MRKKIGRPTTYKPEYADMIVAFFEGPHYTIKDMTITKPDGTQIDKTEREAQPPIFLSDFARTIGVKRGYRQIFAQWAEKHPEFNDALKEAKELEIERIRVNAILGLYAGAFSIFTMKNIAGWRDKSEMEHSGKIRYEKIEVKIIKSSEEINGNTPTNRLAAL